MTEITTTISELLATSRQIAESSQRVAQIAERGGGRRAQRRRRPCSKTEDAVGGIKRQVDVIVDAHAGTGKKSQQIGGILEIIDELAEQTNILAINATIEAAGAGEVGPALRRRRRRDPQARRPRRRLDQGDPRAGRRHPRRGQHHGDGDRERRRRRSTPARGSSPTWRSRSGRSPAWWRRRPRRREEIELSTKQQATAVEQVNLAVDQRRRRPRRRPRPARGRRSRPRRSSRACRAT